MCPCRQAEWRAIRERASLTWTIVDERTHLSYCLTEQCLIPLGQAAGWEAALVDHHRAVLTALAAKVVGGSHVSRASDENGGTTLSFDVWRGHPHEAEVRQLLAGVRSEVIPLWEKVEAYNREHPTETTCKVNFYCGQHVVQEDGET